MNILLKEPAKVDAVIKKITDKYPCKDPAFIEYCVDCMKADLENGNTILLNVAYRYDVQMRTVVADMYYDKLKDIPTDTDFLNDKEW